VSERADILVLGAGAAGLMASIWAGRTLDHAGRSARVLALDGARRLGAKILVAGGGRCNVTHHEVSEGDFCGSSPPAIRKALGRFPVSRTVEFFRGLGVELKREQTGKLFPVTDDARTVLDALLGECRRVGVELRHPCRAEAVEHDGSGFAVRTRTPEGVEGLVLARRLVIATGGKALPRSGSDGAGYAFVRGLGHTLTPRIVPALAPLVLGDGPVGAALKKLSGLTAPAMLELRSAAGKRLAGASGSLLCTHFGLSGPAAMNMSRHWALAHADDPGVALIINWLDGPSADALDRELVASASLSVAAALGGRLPERLLAEVCRLAGADPSAPVRSLPRDTRRAIASMLTQMPVPVAGDRGFTFAECTAGGVPLGEVRLDTMESRVRPGLFLCGEILDVDGRIGGFNFQWAWATGFLAGSAAVDEPGA
jgi:hypothetical protein